MPASRLPSQPWYSSLTIDLFTKVLKNSIFHPFVASLIPLCLRAAETPYTEPAMINSICWAIFICIIWALGPLNEKIAYGPPREIDHEEETIVITGGASGLGRCIAEIYAIQGAAVAVLDVKPAKMAKFDSGVRYYEVDVGDREAVKKVWAKITEELGTPTVLINNAGIVHGKTLLDLRASDLQDSYNTNVLSHYNLTSLFLKPLLASPSGGTLVTISSVLGRSGAAQLSAYSATKAALQAYHTSLAAELAPYPAIKTILVAPGQLSTELFSNLKQGPVAGFFGPVVEVQSLAVKLVKMIGEGRGGVLAEPLYARWIGCLDLLPVGLQWKIRVWSGVDSQMKSFRTKERNGGLGESVVFVEKSG